MTMVLRAVAWLLAIAATIGIWWASAVQVTANGPETAVVRLTWTARPERIEDCRQRSDEELARLPAHMRQSVVCVGTTAAYRLEVRRDEDVILQEIVRGGGLRHDRPLYVFRDIPVPPGRAAIVVRLTRVEAVSTPAQLEPPPPEREEDERRSIAMNDDRRRREAEERVRSREEAIPPRLSLERRLDLAPRQVVLVTYDAERRALTILEDPASR